jgi:hypothetical protein
MQSAPKGDTPDAAYQNAAGKRLITIHLCNAVAFRVAFRKSVKTIFRVAAAESGPGFWSSAEGAWAA